MSLLQRWFVCQALASPVVVDPTGSNIFQLLDFSRRMTLKYSRVRSQGAFLTAADAIFPDASIRRLNVGT
jgi:hypothetical protein